MAMSLSMNRKSKPEPLYYWKWSGKDRDGRKIDGTMTAYKQVDIETDLVNRGILVRSIKRQKKVGGGRGKINSQDIMLFARQLATLIRSGVPALESLAVTAESMRKPLMAKMVNELRNDVTAGETISRAMAKHPKHFDHLFVNLVAAGEESGSLDEMLERVASYKERQEALKGRVKKAMYYPAAVIGVGIAVTTLLLIKVVPQFESLFQGFGSDLPAATQITVNMSEWVQAHWWKTALAIGGTIWGIRRGMATSETFAYRMHKLFLRLPVLGAILHKSSIARFSRTLATTFGAGVPLVDAINTAGRASGNLVYERAIVDVRDDVVSGQQLNFAMRRANLFPIMAVQMVRIGEEAGTLDAMLTRVADYYEEEVNNLVDGMTTLMEPLIIVVLGVLVGGLVVSLYQPIFQMGGAI